MDKIITESFQKMILTTKHVLRQHLSSMEYNVFLALFPNISASYLRNVKNAKMVLSLILVQRLVAMKRKIQN